MATFSILNASLCMVSLAITTFFYRLYRERRWFDGLPQPPHSFFWGHLKLMGEVAKKFPPNTHPQALLTYIAQEYNMKDIFYLDLWPLAHGQAIITHPTLMDQVDVTKSLPKHTLNDDFLAPMIGRNNIAAANGAVWRHLHSAMAPAFAWSHIRNLSTIVVDEVMHFRSILDHHVRTGAAFPMEPTAAKLLFDVSARIIFNLPLHAQTKGSSELADLKSLIRLGQAQFSWNPFFKIRAYVQRIFVSRRLNASIATKIWERYHLLRREKMVPSKKDPNSILDLMLREQVQTGADPGKNGSGAGNMSPAYLELLSTNLKALLLGGHGTTTQTLCFTYMLLSKHPKVLQKLRKEHSNVFHSDFTETVNMIHKSPHKLSELEYTTAVIQETLRLFPVGFGPRAAAESGATLTHNGRTYPIDNDLNVNTLAHTLHYDPAYYTNPAQFDPERFLSVTNNNPEKDVNDIDNENILQSSGVPRSNFRSFGKGVRACLGQNLAQDMLRVILLMTIRDYDFECANYTPNPAPGRVMYTDLDTVLGDVVFQELGLEAKARGTVDMRVRRSN